MNKQPCTRIKKMEKLTPQQEYVKRTFWSQYRFVVLDTETNGKDPGIDEACEVAMLKMVDGEVDLSTLKSWFVKTKKPIPPHVQAVHHISNEEIQDAPSMEDLVPEFQAYCQGMVLVAHNAPFDYGMLPCLQDEKRFKWLDNLRLARHVWPLGTPSPAGTGHPLQAHKNKVLQHWLDVRVDTMGQAAHRAQADILVTAELFKAGMNEFLKKWERVPTWKEITDHMNSPNKIEVMPFGAHRDQPIKELPLKVLRRLLSEHQTGKFDLGVDLEGSLRKEYNLRIKRDHELLPDEKAELAKRRDELRQQERKTVFHTAPNK